MNKRFVGWVVLTVVLLAVVIALAVKIVGSSSDEYRRYESWYATFQTHDWEIAQDGAEVFAEANCGTYGDQNRPAYRVQNEDHVKSMAAVLAGYCPESVVPFTRTIDKYYPEYRDTTRMIRKAH